MFANMLLLNYYNIFLYILLSPLVIYLAKHIWKRRHMYLMALKCYGPPGLPFLGNIYLVSRNYDELGERAHNISFKYKDKYPTCFWIGSTAVVVLSTPEHAKLMFTDPNCFTKGSLHHDNMEPIAGDRPMAITEDLANWKALRKVFSPAFNTVSIKKRMDLFNKYSERFVKKLNTYVENNENDVMQLYTHMATINMDSIYEYLIDYKPVSEEASYAHAYALKRLLSIPMEKVFYPYNVIEFIFKRTKLGKEHYKYKAETTEYILNIVRQRRKELEEHKKNPEKKPDFRETPMDPFFSDETYTDEDIKSQLIHMAMAGFDPSTTVTCFALLALAICTDIQDKVQAELDEVFSDDPDRPVTSEDLTRLDYLERCIKETTRLFPPAFGTSRAGKDAMEIDGVKYPPNTVFHALSYNIHVDERFWPDPMKFDPDRFLPEEIAKQHPFQHLSFAAGPRKCIGNHFSMIYMKTELAHVLRKYNFRTNRYKKIEDVKLVWRTVIIPRYGFNLQIYPRDKK